MQKIYFSRRDQVLQIVTAVYLSILLLAMLAVPIIAARWLSAPTVGALIDPQMQVSALQPASRLRNWPLFMQGIRTGDRLIEVAGQEVHSAGEVWQVMRAYEPEQKVDLTFSSTAGQNQTIQLSVQRLPQPDRVIFLYLPYLTGLVLFASAAWIFLTHRDQTVGWVFAWFAGSLGWVSAGLFDLVTSQRLSFLWLLALPQVGAALAHLALTLPDEDPLIRKQPAAPLAGYFLAALAGVYALTAVSGTGNRLPFLSAILPGAFITGLGALFALAWTIRRYLKASSPFIKAQLRALIMSELIAFIPVVIWLAWNLISGRQIIFTPIYLAPLLVFPVMSGFILQRGRHSRTEAFVGRAAVYSGLGVLVAVGYALAVAGITLILNQVFSLSNPLIAGGLFFIAALGFFPLRERLETGLDRLFFRGETAFRERLSTFSGELTHLVDVSEIARVLRRYVQDTLQPAMLHIFVFDPLTEQYIAARDESGRRTSDLRFTHTNSLVQVLSRRQDGLFLSPTEDLPLELNPDKARLKLLNAHVFIPLQGRQRLLGWMALGGDGLDISSRNLSFLDSLGDQASLAVERAQMVSNMEKRVRELDVLTRVAQGVNVTIQLDDIYELVYAQTTQLVPADEFRIVLKEPNSEDLIQVFVIQGDERLDSLENKTLSGEKLLEADVIRQGRAILTEDYRRECEQRGFLVQASDRYAWMTVPLNAGVAPIGAISLGLNDPASRYTSEQLRTTQAIADQAAGAIVKARLLAETERRARQLKSLNDVTRQLTSTLNPEHLLKNILTSAVEILECEAGSLLMVDHQTDELVFKVALGPVAEALVEKRMPSDKGVVGKSFHSHEALIVNDVQSSKEWFSKPDESTGFRTRSLLVVPLIVKDESLGVLEVINRKNGEFFTQDDLELLTAFALQAAVAIENARLYTMTDQALAEKVEELSVMQRIDRELNTSLDVGRAMQITLDWAMRQSAAAAGWVGIVDQDGVRLAASQGYKAEMSPYAENPIPADYAHLEEVRTLGRPLQLNLDGKKGFLDGARSQVIIPIQREKNLAGLLVLEGLQPELCSDEILEFLQRLGDHASIAIANAQLYNAVQAANVAKSEFVSFVAHELKNPMTSIKGYTELLAAKAVGPVNDAQSNFLSVIRSNIERMNTLVSDLNDLSKIEAGRLRLDFAVTSLQDVVTEVERSTRRQIEDKSQQLVINLPSDLAGIWADRSRLTQILVNLISNAHKYTEQGGKILLGANRSRNEWDSQGPPEVMHVWVQDTGIGIAPEDQERIFQKFFRSEDPKTREVPGTGLGLNITRSLVEMQGGKIWFESEFRKGTTFHFTIPVAEQQAAKS